MDKQEFLQVELSQISQVYSGKRDCCRCGCGGDYTATTFMDNPRDKVNDGYVLKQLKRAKRLINAGADYDSGENYFDVQTGTNRTLTFYFDELKKEPVAPYVFHIGNATVTTNNINELREYVEEISQKLRKGEEYGKHIADFIFDVEKTYQSFHGLGQDDWEMVHQR